MVYNFFDRKSSGETKMKIFLTVNQLKNYANQFLENSRKKVHPSFIDNIWGADLADICK